MYSSTKGIHSSIVFFIGRSARKTDIRIHKQIYTHHLKDLIIHKKDIRNRWFPHSIFNENKIHPSTMFIHSFFSWASNDKERYTHPHKINIPIHFKTRDTHPQSMYSSTVAPIEISMKIKLYPSPQKIYSSIHFCHWYFYGKKGILNRKKEKRYDYPLFSLIEMSMTKKRYSSTKKI